VKVVKAVLAILFSLALMFAGIPAASACAKTVSKPCCHCGGKASCCKTTNPQPAGQNPAAPAPRSTQTDFLPAICLAASVPALPPAPGHGSLSVNSIPPTRAVPLFTRDCAFLI
jgi:hypothetical protein